MVPAAYVCRYAMHARTHSRTRSARRGQPPRTGGESRIRDGRRVSKTTWVGVARPLSRSTTHRYLQRGYACAECSDGQERKEWGARRENWRWLRRETARERVYGGRGHGCSAGVWICNNLCVCVCVCVARRPPARAGSLCLYPASARRPVTHTPLVSAAREAGSPLLPRVSIRSYAVEAGNQAGRRAGGQAGGGGAGGGGVGLGGSTGRRPSPPAAPRSGRGAVAGAPVASTLARLASSVRACAGAAAHYCSHAGARRGFSHSSAAAEPETVGAIWARRGSQER